MKVNQNFSIFAGPQADNYGQGTKTGRQDQTKQPFRSVNGSYLNGQFDPIARKRAMAQQRAGKMISDAFSGDKKLDDEQKDRAARIDQHYRVMSDSYKEIRAIDARKEELRQEYGVDMDSQEQKDLEILEKYNRKGRGVAAWYDTEMTPAEQKRALELEAQGYGEKGYTEYQQRALGLDAGKDVPASQILDAKQQIVNESGTIRAMKLERLKYHEMIDANKEADAVMEAASDEIVGMLVEEAKDNIDEKNEEELEKVEENKKEKKEEQEKIEEARERREELEALTDPEHAEKERRRTDETEVAFGDALTEGMLRMQGIKSNIEQEVADMMLRMKLVAVETTSIKVDETI